MKVCVYGLWHLGSVTAACLAASGHDVAGLDDDSSTVSGLLAARPPVSEPGLPELVKEGIRTGHLRFTTDTASALEGARILWITFDTPVDDEDRADVDHVLERASALFPLLEDGAVVLVSSQLPVGSCRKLEQSYAAQQTGRRVGFACSPENLRLGKAISIFLEPDRVVVGVRTDTDRAAIEQLLHPVTKRIEWMSVESAEMTKHALNAFLAVSVTFANELATLCEHVGADAKEVERGLKSEARIGSKAYLSPGGAFAGGTLARDVNFLTGIAIGDGIQIPLLAAVLPSNNNHKGWAARKIREILGELNGKTVAVWGLTYKPGTDTLRRSSAIELCRWLICKGAKVQAYDPMVREPAAELVGLGLSASPEAAARGADAAVVMTEWPQFRKIELEKVMGTLRSPNLLDAGRFLAAQAAGIRGINYLAVGTRGRKDQT